MAISASKGDREYLKFKESTVTSGQVGVVVVNPDGSNVGASVTVDTEFPAAAALADNTANPTTTKVGAFLMVYDGSTWDMLRGDSTNGALVNLGSNNDVVQIPLRLSNAVTVTSPAASNTASITIKGTVMMMIVVCPALDTGDTFNFSLTDTAGYVLYQSEEFVQNAQYRVQPSYQIPLDGAVTLTITCSSAQESNRAFTVVIWYK